MKKKLIRIKMILSVMILTAVLMACDNSGAGADRVAAETDRVAAAETETHGVSTVAAGKQFSLEDIPAFDSEPYVAVNGNEPFFKNSDLTTQSFEKYSDLDDLGRCGVAFANIGTDIMPTQERGAIGQVKPSGWQTVKYDSVDGKYLYNRCHLIGFQLAGENANEKNLITGTRYLNVQGMLPFENMVADYVKETDHHVLYRVTPIYDGNNLVASGVLMEAESVEDKGEAIEFCVYVYNEQPGIAIDHATGDSWMAESETKQEADSKVDPKADPEGTTYVLNTNTKKFHDPSCSSVNQMNESNKQSFTGDREDLIAQGYVPCKRCNP